MDNKAAEILERIIFNEKEINVDKELKIADRVLKKSKEVLAWQKGREKNIKRVAVGAGVVAAGAGLYAWRQHRKQKAEEEAKKKAEQKG
jgi:hypothetical protein